MLFKRILFFLLLSGMARAELDLSFGVSFSKAPYYPSPLVLKPSVSTTQNYKNQPTKTAALRPIPLRSVDVFENLTHNYQRLIAPQDFVYKKGLSPAALTLPKIVINSVLPKLTFHSEAEYSLTPLPDRPAASELKLLSETTSTEKLVEMSDNEYKMLQALIFKDIQKRPEPAMILLVDLMKSEFKHQATWNYAEIAKQFDLNNEFKNKMLSLALEKPNTSFTKKALESLIKSADLLTLNDIEQIETKANKSDIGFKNDYYTLKKSQYLAREGDLSYALSLLSSIPNSSKVVVESKILAANLKYRLGDLNAATKTLESAIPQLSSDSKNKLRNLAYLTMGRMYFQNANYKQAFNAYLKIDKSSGFWLESSTEQALAQIMNGDYIGAAGNMFSLHTEYFRKAYAPYSYVVRAVGYLNLCQYGDAVTVIADLDRRYTELSNKLSKFQKSHPNASSYYDLARGALNDNSSDIQDALPKSFIIEMARDPSFMAMQYEINKSEQEINQFQQISQNMGTLYKKINLDLTLIVQNKTKNNSLNIDKNTQLSLKIEQSILAGAKPRIDRVKAAAFEKIQQDKEKLKSTASIMLQKRFNREVASLAEIIQQKDVLAYEIYSGAGEQLRFQMAGGKVDDRKPASDKALTPEEKESYHWKYRGEFWEDEIGHYRSSLTNICSKN